jgi:hypothetical protein
MLDYRAMAAYSFKREAQGAYLDIARRELVDDWEQEIACAAFLASRRRLSRDNAFRFFRKAAYAALRSMGFRRRQHTPWLAPILIP